MNESSHIGMEEPHIEAISKNKWQKQLTSNLSFFCLKPLIKWSDASPTAYLQSKTKMPIKVFIFTNFILEKQFQFNDE